MMCYKPTPLFRADVRKIALGLIIRTIRYEPDFFGHYPLVNNVLGGTTYTKGGHYSPVNIVLR